MVDPFSIAAGGVGLLDVCFRAGQYLVNLKKSSASIDKDLTDLQNEVNSIRSSYGSLKSIWGTHHKSHPTGLESSIEHAPGLWEAVRKNSDAAEALLQELVTSLRKIVDDKKVDGKIGSMDEMSDSNRGRKSSRIDGLKKTFKLQSKEVDLHGLRQRLGNCQAQLQILLTALSFLYASRTFKSTDLSLSHLSEKVDDQFQQLQFSLNYQLAVLTARFEDSKSDSLRSTIDSAAAVASSISLNRHFIIPQTVSSIYTGRRSKLKELKYAYDTSSPLQNERKEQRRFVVYGLGGSGKTQFCCKFAQDTRENFWGVFWIDGSSRDHARHSFTEIAKVGGVEPNEQAAKSWLASLQQPWLLIIDNADDPDVSLEDYIPQGERGFILITTRNPSNRSWGTLNPPSYAFEALEDDEASDLLLKAAEQPSPWSLSVRSTADSIAKALGALPLALIHAGKAILDGICSLDNYLEVYWRSWNTIRRARSRSPSTTTGHRNLNMNIYSTFEIIYIGLEHREGEDSEDAVELLKMFSFLYREKIEFGMLVAAATNPRLEQKQWESTSKDDLAASKQHLIWRQSLRQWVTTSIGAFLTANDRPALPTALHDFDAANPFDEDRLRNALALLVQLGLSMHNRRSDSYSIHPLVHVWVRERPLTSTAEQAVWCQAATNVLARCILIQPPADRLSIDEKLRRNALPHLQHLRGRQEEIRSRLTGNLEYRKTRLRSWFFPLHIGPSTVGRREASECTKFSLVYSKNGDFHKAAVLQEAVRDFLCANFGTDHIWSIGITRLLVGTYIEQFRNTDALELQRQVLQNCHNSLGPDHPTTLKVKDTLTVILRHRGQFHEGRRISEEVVSDMIRVLGPDHEDTLIAKLNLGRVWSSFFAYRETLELENDVLERMKSTLGPSHLETLNAQEDVAVAYLDVQEDDPLIRRDNLNKALGMIKEVVQVRERKLGKEQPYTLLAFVQQARILDGLGRSEEAEEIFRAKIDIAIRNLGPNHIGVQLGKAFLSRSLIHQQRYADAEKVLLDVTSKSKYRASVREDGEHTDRIRYLWMLLECYEIQGKVDDAIRTGEEMYEAVVTIGGERLGTKHPFAKRLAEKWIELRERKEAMTASASEAATDNKDVSTVLC